MILRSNKDAQMAPVSVVDWQESVDDAVTCENWGRVLEFQEPELCGKPFREPTFSGMDGHHNEVQVAYVSWLCQRQDQVEWRLLG